MENRLQVERETAGRGHPESPVGVDRLPNEILRLIFTIAHDSETHLGDQPCFQSVYEEGCVLPAITQVSQRWRSIVLGTPRLWTRIGLMEESTTRMFLSRSKDALLDISFFPPTHSTSLPTFLEPLIPYSHRWRSLECIAGLDFPLAIVTVAVPRLETLRLKASKSLVHTFYQPVESLTLTGGPIFNKSPSLCELELDGIYIPPTHAIYTGLKTLRLVGMRVASLEIIGFLSDLQSCSLLEVLRLDRVVLGAGHVGGSWPGGSINFPRLREIHIIRLDAAVIRDILSLISVPPTAKVVVESEDWGECTLREIAPLSMPFDNITQHIMRIQHLRCTATACTAHFKGYATADDKGPVLLEMIFAPRIHVAPIGSRALQTVFQVLPLAGLASVHFDSITKLRTVSMVQALEKLPFVKRLVFSACRAPYVRRLTITPTRHLCPALERLEILSVDITYEDLVDLVESRSTRSSSEGLGGLRSMHVERCPGLGETAVLSTFADVVDVSFVA
ncbi:hypothetical protein BOTBODRAFT_33939 [Botryobasidium botryosum FD-172 SS1]|uniref:Uncharacterized protein n=1 Tax=Botryobasidium botryosum (strain FD-172 SS1) TaxID=930990 RepID=A0A067MBB0_BOTB1|nr:hypothetical protein BOTBODRAFT_33939 [Botryobasidium botryosum FD-172 SS1]